MLNDCEKFCHILSKLFLSIVTIKKELNRTNSVFTVYIVS